jgi:hypothetical protein
MAATTAVFALPIFLVPLKWARWFGWTIPQQTDLAVHFFGRCLGAFILIVVHVWGALLRIQPISETLEIGMYSGLALLTILFYPVHG